MYERINKSKSDVNLSVQEIFVAAKCKGESMGSPSKKNSNKSEDVKLQNLHNITGSTKCIDTSQVNDKCESKSGDNIYLDYSMQILDPKNTPLRWYPNEKEIKVLLVPQMGDQVLIEFTAPKNGTVQDIITPLEYLFKRQIIHILLVTDPVHFVRYVIRIFPDPDNQEPPSQPATHEDTMLSRSLDENNVNEFENESVRFEERSTMGLKRSLQVLIIYPTPPCKGSITVAIDDLQCLDENKYINDVIIDFYLKYLVHETLSTDDRERIHLFSSFFYTRLINPRRKTTSSSRLSDLEENAEIQHTEVKRWTKDVNIFEKDFVVVPIHENDHWFLAIISYLNMIGDELNPKPTIQNKCPRIIIFESISALKFTRLTVAQTLINYVRCEYKEKFGRNCVLSKNDLQVSYPDVPEQNNTTDCGLYLLQYTEKFFKDYVTDQKMIYPLESLKNWFADDVIREKRHDLHKLIVKLAANSQIFKKRRMS